MDVIPNPWKFTREQRLSALQSGQFERDAESLQAQGLVGWWPLGVFGADTDHDHSGFATHGTRTNGPSSIVVAHPKLGCTQALNLDATSDYVALSKTVLTAGSPFSISWWEWIHTDTAGIPARFVLPMNGSSDHFLIARSNTYAASYDNLTCGKSPGTAASKRSTAVSTTAASVGVWKHFCVTCADPQSSTTADFAIYENGVSKTVLSGGNYGTVTANRIGYDGANQPSSCYMSDVRFYDHILAPEAVAAIYDDPLGLVRPIGLRTISFASLPTINGDIAQTIPQWVTA